MATEYHVFVKADRYFSNNYIWHCTAELIKPGMNLTLRDLGLKKSFGEKLGIKGIFLFYNLLLASRYQYFTT